MNPKLSRRGAKIVDALTDHVAENFRDGAEHVIIPWEITHQMPIDGGESYLAQRVIGETLNRLGREFPNARYGEYFDENGFVNGWNGDGKTHLPRIVLSRPAPWNILGAIFRPVAFVAGMVSVAGLVLVVWRLFF